jgi:penicillin G amidase
MDALTRTAMRACPTQAIQSRVNLMRRRIILLIFTLLLVAVLVAAGGAYWIAKRAEPTYDGSIALSGLQAPVLVRYGPRAVPTIEADDIHDLLFAQGYVVASERMWQMDLLRRLASGRLAEVFGPLVLPADRFFRTIGLDREAKRSLAALEDSDRRLLAAYAAGVNAYQAEAKSRRRLPLEYLIAGVEPGHWTPEDSLLIGGYMAWSQSYNLRSELTFLRLAARIGPERARELFPIDAGVPAPEVPPELTRELSGHLMRGSPRSDGGQGLTIDPVLQILARLGLPLPAAASNGWAVKGPRTERGEALLANDPHLAASMPGIWYELELITPQLQVVGASLPGVPLVMIGHNRDLAWGFTSTIADTQDVFIERLMPDGRHVERPGGQQEPIDTRFERLLVKGAEPVDLEIRSTSHGVIINDILGPITKTPMDLPGIDTPHLLALRQTNDLPDLAFGGLVRLNQAETLAEAGAAVLSFRHVVLNLMLAHRDGGIALQVSGVFPQRGKGSGAFPSPGWVDGYAWEGLVPQTLNPRILDPAGSALITANNRIVPIDYPVTISNAWMAPFRAQRIAERLDAAGPLTPEVMGEIQNDRVSTQARLTRVVLRKIEMELRAVDPDAWTIAADELLDWDGDMAGHSRAGAFFALLEPALYRALYSDELGEDLEVLSSMAMFAYSPLQETLRSGRSSFWDDVTTPWTEGPAEILARALKAAKSELDARTGLLETTGLDRIRTLTFPHAFGVLPLVGRLFDVGPIGVGGHADTINVMKPMPLAPEEAIFIPSMRVVYTPADWTRTRGIQPLGQSGHLFSPYRTDQLEGWLTGETYAWPWSGPSEDESIGSLRLTPPP